MKPFRTAWQRVTALANRQAPGSLLHGSSACRVVRSPCLSIDEQREKPRPAARRLPVFATLCLALTGAVAQGLPAPLLALDFDGLAQGQLPAGVRVQTQFRTPDVVPGVQGMAWRSDGFSSYTEAPLTLDARAGFTLSLWVALESYPSDREVPVRELSPSSIAQQAAGDQGFDLFIDTFGRWGLRVATSQGELKLRAPQRFPLRRWTHLVATVDPATGAVTLYQDGAQVAATAGPPGLSLRLAAVPLRLAMPAVLATILEFKINRLNAAFDLVTVHPGALSPAQLALLPGPTAGHTPDAEAALQVPASRFAGDLQRPRIHPMPPANWTNEPHGLIHFGGAWHLFYQRTPNGPYKTQMHWGHLRSRDLVTWESLPDALRPELQTEDFGFDMKGIWSGHVIAEGGQAMAFYTSVNHGSRLAASNPGIAMAVSTDAQLRDWRKLGPILNTEGVQDFRDPFLWNEAGRWHMLIGAALEGGGGLDYWVLEPDEKGRKGSRWQRQRRFSNLSYRVMDPGSVIWEMPVFQRLAGNTWILLVNPIGGQVSKYGEPATRAVYWTGEWTDGLFKPFFREPRPLDILPGHLAPTVARAADGQLRAIGIIDERRSPASQERAGWANMFGLPRSWRLLPDGRTLGQAPAPELQALRAPPRLEGQAIALGGAAPWAFDPGLHAYELQLDFEASPTAPGLLSIDLLAAPDGREVTRLQIDPAQGLVKLDKSRASLAGEDEGPMLLQGRYDTQAFGALRTLRVFVDGSSIEVFINEAAAYAVRSYPTLPASTGVRIAQTGKPEATARVSLWPLRMPSSDAAPLQPPPRPVAGPTATKPPASAPATSHHH